MFVHRLRAPRPCMPTSPTLRLFPTQLFQMHAIHSVHVSVQVSIPPRRLGHPWSHGQPFVRSTHVSMQNSYFSEPRFRLTNPAMSIVQNFRVGRVKGWQKPTQPHHPKTNFHAPPTGKVDLFSVWYERSGHDHNFQRSNPKRPKPWPMCPFSPHWSSHPK